MKFMLALLALALSCLSTNVAKVQDRTELEAARILALRREGPPALERLCAFYDTLPAGPEKEDLEREIDAVAAQRYATISRLYWYTDLELAKNAARAAHKPILSLRILGRLDEDQSCANSRFFRVVLYADPDVSLFLRENFVLHWSSERAVPKVTIDYGDGRRIDTTLGGNSAHYVLDWDGRALDILPGLYSPKAFVRGLGEVLPLALESPSLGDKERALKVGALHRRLDDSAAERWSSRVETKPVPKPLDQGILDAETIALSKAGPEMKTLGALRGGRGVAFGTAGAKHLDEARLSAPSVALLRRLAPSDWSNGQRSVSGSEFDTLVAVFEGEIARDTETNESKLRPRAHAAFVYGDQLYDFATINRFVYAQVFRTPAEDPWLGLATPFLFTGLPNDGITVPQGAGR